MYNYACSIKTVGCAGVAMDLVVDVRLGKDGPDYSAKALLRQVNSLTAENATLQRDYEGRIAELETRLVCAERRAADQAARDSEHIKRLTRQRDAAETSLNRLSTSHLDLCQCIEEHFGADEVRKMLIKLAMARHSMYTSTGLETQALPSTITTNEEQRIGQHAECNFACSEHTQPLYDTSSGNGQHEGIDKQPETTSSESAELEARGEAPSSSTSTICKVVDASAEIDI